MPSAAASAAEIVLISHLNNQAMTFFRFAASKDILQPTSDSGSSKVTVATTQIWAGKKARAPVGRTQALREARNVPNLEPIRGSLSTF